MKVSSVLSIVLLIAAVSMTTVSARNWHVGTNGLTRFDNNCDFNGHDIGTFPASSEQCGGICIANPRCTHYTQSGGTCFMKRNRGSLHEQSHSGAVCGFIPGRSRQPI
jgi:peroxidase